MCWKRHTVTETDNFSICSTEGEENSHDSSATSPSIAEDDEEVDGSGSEQNSVDGHKQKAARETGEDEIMV